MSKKVNAEKQGCLTTSEALEQVLTPVNPVDRPAEIRKICTLIGNLKMDIDKLRLDTVTYYLEQILTPVNRKYVIGEVSTLDTQLYESYYQLRPNKPSPNDIFYIRFSVKNNRLYVKACYPQKKRTQLVQVRTSQQLLNFIARNHIEWLLGGENGDNSKTST